MCFCVMSCFCVDISVASRCDVSACVREWVYKGVGGGGCVGPKFQQAMSTRTQTRCRSRSVGRSNRGSGFGGDGDGGAQGGGGLCMWLG